MALLPPDKQVEITFPRDMGNNEKGDFFERVVEQWLKLLRFNVTRRVRVAGAEIDLLSNSLDIPETVFVECKAHKEPLSANVISQLIGNREVHDAEKAWLFSTSDLGKDAQGMYQEILKNPVKAKRFTWFGPEKILDLLSNHGLIVDLSDPAKLGLNHDFGSSTLIVHPKGYYWCLEILRDGVPIEVIVRGGKGELVERAEAQRIASDSSGANALPLRAEADGTTRQLQLVGRVDAPVARVSSGDAWDDLRPSRPEDFVGRQDLIDKVKEFVDAVVNGRSETRILALQGPSGWGKSSLVLKLAHLAKKGGLGQVSFTAIDTRSATDASFVARAVKLALEDAAAQKMVNLDGDVKVENVLHPMSASSVREACLQLDSNGQLIFLVFDQFEELFTKEPLFSTFEAIQSLCSDLEARQYPIVLGFAWKTDISLPQTHPAYYLWHSLEDRRFDVRVDAFDSGDTKRIFNKAEKAMGTELTRPLRARLQEQCQGYPWLLKKLIVHVSRRLNTVESQYQLLERELDVELLFKEDLADVSPAEEKCLRYIAANGPVYISDVEDRYGAKVAHALLQRRLLVRSGINYVVYWDIFRDYLTEGRVPTIPWSRLFQREPNIGIRAVQALSALGPTSTKKLAQALGTTLRTVQNVIADLFALQLIDSTTGEFHVAAHLKDKSPIGIGKYVQRQLSRHAVYQWLSKHAKIENVDNATLDAAVMETRPKDIVLSEASQRQFAMNMRRWLLFAGLLELQGARVQLTSGNGSQLGVMQPGRSSRGFLAAGTKDSLLQLVRDLIGKQRGVPESVLQTSGLRNACYDGIALGVLDRTNDGRIVLVDQTLELSGVEEYLRHAVLGQEVIQYASALLGERQLSNDELGEQIKKMLHATWKPASARRYATGLRGYLDWATSRNSERG